MKEKWFDDFVVGEVFRSPSYTVTESELVDFAFKFDPQYFHISKPDAEASPFGGLIASGWHICALAFRLFMDNRPYRDASLGAPGVDKLQWLAPVRPGDTLRVIVTVSQTRRSTSKPDRGIVNLDWSMLNQNDVQVMSMTGPVFLLRKPGDVR